MVNSGPVHLYLCTFFCYLMYFTTYSESRLLLYLNNKFCRWENLNYLYKFILELKKIIWCTSLPILNAGCLLHGPVPLPSAVHTAWQRANPSWGLRRHHVFPHSAVGEVTRSKREFTPIITIRVFLRLPAILANTHRISHNLEKLHNQFLPHHVFIHFLKHY